MFVLKSYNSATVPGPSATETKLCRASVCYYTNNTRFLELYITHDVSSDEVSWETNVSVTEYKKSCIYPDPCTSTVSELYEQNIRAIYTMKNKTRLT